ELLGNDGLLNRRALSMVVEAKMDKSLLQDRRAKLLEAIASGKHTSPLWQRKAGQALAAIDHGLNNFDRFSLVGEKYRTIMKDQGQLEENNGMTVPEREDYVHHVVQFETGFNLPFGVNTIGTSTGFRKERDYDSFVDMLSAGTVPKSMDAVEALRSR